jgi:hypothetical protein
LGRGTPAQTGLFYPLDLAWTRLAADTAAKNEPRRYASLLHCISQTYRYERLRGAPVLAPFLAATISAFLGSLLAALSSARSPAHSDSCLSEGCAAGLLARQRLLE